MPRLSEDTMAKLRRLRGNRSLEEAAAGIGITPRALKSYELGERIPKDGVKKQIAAYYGRTVNYIFFT